MKKILKKLLPEIVFLKLKMYSLKLKSIRLYLYDIKHFTSINKSSIEDYNRLRLERLITLNYHSIEKGLTNLNFRVGFGNKAISGLLYSLEKWLEMDLEISNIRVQTGLSVLNSYILKHEETNIDLKRIKEILKKFNYTEKKAIGGVLRFSTNLMNFETMNFTALVENRHSVRDFSNGSFDYLHLKRALEIALKSPSVCNRQGWKILMINNSELISRVLTAQGGFNNFGSNIKSLLVVVSLNDYYMYPSERNQGYIDGGILSMSLLYSLTSSSFASCPLNCSFSIHQDKDIRHMLKMKLNQSFISMIAVGMYEDINIVTKSNRDNFESKIEVFE